MTTETDNYNLMPNYTRLPVTMSRGKGCWLWDNQGNQYLDALSGIGVCGLGHTHPAITKAISEQASTLVHCSNLYHIDSQQRLAQKLCQLAGMDTAFFGNSGAESIEAAIKLARKYGHQKGVKSPTIIVTENSFHGRTLATLSATGNRKVQAGFEPLVQGFIRVPFNDIPAIEAVAKNSQDVVAILVEPIQGEGGINVPDEDFLAAIRALCNDNDWLMMLDEVQTGIGRTGKWFAYQHTEIVPDVISLAKGLGNGVPIGACLASGKAAKLLQAGSHGSTFGGNPLVCSAALAVLEIIEKEQLLERATQMGQQIRSALDSQFQHNPAINTIRGKGLMIGIELQQECNELLVQALEIGLLISIQAGRIIRLLPPLNINDHDASLLIERLSTLINSFINQQAA